MIRSIIICGAMMFGLMLPLQADQMKRILRLLERSEIEKAVEALREGLQEESNHAGYLWIAADLVSSDSLPYYDLDSAYILIKNAFVGYDSASEDQIRDFEKIPFDRSLIERSDANIRDLHWDRTQLALSHDALTEFNMKYPDAPQRLLADFQIDSLGFEAAVLQGTWQAYLDYQRKYPGSKFNDQAEGRYQRLLYQDKTGTGSEESLTSFVEKYTDSPYREQAIGRLLKFKLFWNSADSLIEFSRRYYPSLHAQKALSYAFHINKNLIVDPFFAGHYGQIDSLQEQHQLSQSNVFLLPTALGVSVVSLEDFTVRALSLDQVTGDFIHCSPYSLDYFFGRRAGRDVLIQRKGALAFEGDFVSAKNIGLGAVLLLKPDGIGTLIHKSGSVILENIEEADLIGNQWLKVQRAGKWTLASLNGVLLSDFVYDEIFEEGNFWIFEKDGLYAFSNKKSINDEAGTGGFTLIFKYDDYEVVDENWMIGFKGSREGLINQDLDFIIPWGDHVIYPYKEVPYAKNNGKYTIYPQIDGLVQQSYDEVLVNKNWMVFKRDSWYYKSLKQEIPMQFADSAGLIGEFYLMTVDSTKSALHFSTDTTLELSNGAQIVELTSAGHGADKTEEVYLNIIEEKAQRLYAGNGNLLFTLEEEQVSKSIGDSLFIVINSRGKKGIMTASGNWLIQPQYDFVSRSGDMLNLLLGSKIGGYQLSDSSFFSTSYVSNIEPFGKYFLTAQESGVGVVDADEQHLMEFRYRNLKLMNDSLVWVQTDSSWQIQDVISQQIMQYGVRSYEKMQLPLGHVYKVTTSRGYGLLSQDGSYIIAPGFSDIRMISDGTNYFFIGEKSVPEAGFYIWVGFDADGNKIFSEAYREEFYDQIACD
jgi:hypothetical protein